MKIMHLALAAFLAMGAGTALAQDANQGNQSTQSTTQDPNAPGVKEFGEDVTKAGQTKEENQAYFATLPAEKQAEIKRVCLADIVKPEPTHPPVLVLFCENIADAPEKTTPQ